MMTVAVSAWSDPDLELWSDSDLKHYMYNAATRGDDSWYDSDSEVEHFEWELDVACMLPEEMHGYREPMMKGDGTLEYH